jgi:hypothetical protein
MMLFNTRKVTGWILAAGLTAGVSGGLSGCKLSAVKSMLHGTDSGNSELSAIVESERRFLNAQIDAAGRANNPALQWNYIHMLELLESLPDAKVLREAGVTDLKGFVDGIIDSDLGKDPAYQAIWKEGGQIQGLNITSEEFLDFFRGKGPAGEILKKQLGGGTIFSGDIPNSEIRAIVSEAPMLMGYLHDLPGIARALSDFKAEGARGQQRFVTRLMTNLFHNGPDAGYWKDFMTSGVSNKLGNEKLQRLFKGTVFLEGGQLSYPSPKAAGGFLHAALDRLSQATRNGRHKIFFEASKFFAGKLRGLVAEMLTLNPTNTLKQISQLGAEAARLNIPALSAAISEVGARVDGYLQGIKSSGIVERLPPEGPAYEFTRNQGGIFSNQALDGVTAEFSQSADRFVATSTSDGRRTTRSISVDPVSEPMRQIVGQSFNKGGQGVPEDLEGTGNQAVQNNAVRELAIDLQSLSKYTEALRSGGGNQSTVKVEIEKKVSEIGKKVAEIERVKSTLEQRERAEFDRMKSEFASAKERLRAP